MIKDLKTMSKLMEEIKQKYPGRGFRIRRVDKNLWTVTLRPKNGELSSVIYIRTED